MLAWWWSCIFVPQKDPRHRRHRRLRHLCALECYLQETGISTVLQQLPAIATTRVQTCAKRFLFSSRRSISRAVRFVIWWCGLHLFLLKSFLRCGGCKVSSNPCSYRGLPEARMAGATVEETAWGRQHLHFCWLCASGCQPLAGESCPILLEVLVVCFVFVLHGDSSMDYVSIQFSSLLYAHCRHDWCCHCINSVNLQNAIVFPAW